SRGSVAERHGVPSRLSGVGFKWPKSGNKSRDRRPLREYPDGLGGAAGPARRMCYRGSELAPVRGMRRLGRSARFALCAVVAPPFAPSLLRAVFALSLVLLPARAFAIHRQMPFLVSVTPTPGTCHNGAPSQGLPRWVAFESSGDLLHTGSLGQQIFLLESMVIPGLDCSDKPPGPELRQRHRLGTGAPPRQTCSAGHVGDVVGHGLRYGR